MSAKQRVFSAILGAILAASLGPVEAARADELLLT